MSRTKRKRLFLWGLAGIALIFLFCLAIGATLDHSVVAFSVPMLPLVFGMASKDIIFSTIPSNLKKPGTYMEQDTSLASRALPSAARRILIIGQRLAAGTVAQAIPMQIFSEADAATYFGFGSMLHLMCRAAIKTNPYADITAIGLDDNGAGVAATGTHTITGPATSAGTIRIYIADQYVDVAIANADTATAIATNIKAAVNAKADFPVTAANVAGVLTYTARNKGLCGNDIGLGYLITSAAGVACATVAMATGATNPGLQTALTAVYGTRYNLIVTPFNNQTDLATLKTHVEGVSGPLEQRGSVGIYATIGALAGATTLSGQVNSTRIVGAFVRYTAATQMWEPSWQVAAIVAAGISAVSDIAEPIKNMNLVQIAAPEVADALSRTEQESCLNGGVSPIEVGPGQTPRLVRMPATYISDVNSQLVFLDIHKIFGMDYARDAAISDITAYAPKKIIRDSGPGRVPTVNVLRSIVLSTAYKLQEAGVLTGVSNYQNQFIVEEDLSNPGQMNILMPSPVVDGLYVVAVKQVLY